MINVESGLLAFLRQTAIFASISRSQHNQSTQASGNIAHDCFAR
jgi:hypothetical protein